MIKVKVFGSGSAGNAYLLDDGYSQLMIECGVQFKKVQQGMMYDLNSIVGCLVTHEHRDHCRYLNQLIAETSIDVYCTKGTYQGIIDDSVLNIKKDSHYRFNHAKYKETVKIGTWYVTPFKTEHDVNEPCGFLIDNTAGDRLVFVTDSYYVKYKFPNVTHMMIEANYDNDTIEENLNKDKFSKKLKTRIKESHFDLKNTTEFVMVNKSERLQEIWLLHLSDSNSNAKMFKETIQKVSGVPVYIA